MKNLGGSLDTIQSSIANLKQNLPFSQDTNDSYVTNSRFSSTINPNTIVNTAPVKHLKHLLKDGDNTFTTRSSQSLKVSNITDFTKHSSNSSNQYNNNFDHD